MARFSGQTSNSTIFYFGPTNPNQMMYCYVKYSGSTNNVARTASVDCELYVYFKYDYSFWFGPNSGNNGDATIIVGGTEYNRRR